MLKAGLVGLVGHLGEPVKHFNGIILRLFILQLAILPTQLRDMRMTIDEQLLTITQLFHYRFQILGLMIYDRVLINQICLCLTQ